MFSLRSINANGGDSCIRSLVLELSKKWTLTNLFFDLQFSYCPLTCRCNSRKHHKINGQHGELLHISSNDKMLPCEESLTKDSSVYMCRKDLEKPDVRI